MGRTIHVAFYNGGPHSVYLLDGDRLEDRRTDDTDTAPGDRANIAIDPYDVPMVPHQGHYLVALFDAKHVLITPAYAKVPILSIHGPSRWSLGTRFVTVDR